MMEIARSGGRPSDLAAGAAVVRPNMLEWLRAHEQTEAAISRFWGVVLVSALDEQLDRTDAQYGVDVFWKAFIDESRGISDRDSYRAAGRFIRWVQKSGGECGRHGADARAGAGN